MGEITLYTGTALSRITDWTRLDAGARHRRAAEACRDRDAATLIDLTLAVMRLQGAAGAHLSPHSARAYATGIRQLLTAWSGERLLSPAPDSGAVWLRQLETAGLKPATVSLRLAAARALYRALRWSGAVTVDPFKDIRPARDPVPPWEKRKPYPPAAVTALLDHAGPEDRVLVLLCAHAGLRVMEAVALRWRDIDLTAGELTVVAGKGGKRAVVPLSRKLRDALKALSRTGEHVLSYRSTQQARYRMRQLCRRAGVECLALHSLRHYAGTRLYAETGKLESAQKLLRHSTIATTQVYVHHADDSVKRQVTDW